MVWRAFDGGLWFNGLGDGSKVVHVGLDEVGGKSITIFVNYQT